MKDDETDNEYVRWCQRRAGPEFKLLGKNSLGELCMATPAIVSDGLIVRTESQLLRIK